MIRLKDIAERAGVSVMTVSKAMRDAPDVAVATKAKLRKLADEMGYVPDGAAQGLRRRSTKLFGLVIPSINSPALARALLALESEIESSQHDLLIGQTLNDASREERIIERFLSRRVDGLFIWPVYRLEQEAAIYHKLRRLRLPVVLLGPTADFCNTFASVRVKDTEAAQSMTQELIRLGHRNIAYFTGPSMSPIAQDRLNGYKRALMEAGIPFRHDLVFPAGSTINEGTAAGQQFLEEAPGATALQADNDLVAVGVGEALFKAGCHIPNTYSLAGFGNVLCAEYYRIPISTINQPKYRLGLKAVELMRELQNGHPARQVSLSGEIVMRASTAPPHS